MHFEIQLLVFAQLMMTSYAQDECLNGISFSSGKTKSPKNFIYDAGEVVNITVSLNCSLNDNLFWGRLNPLKAFLDTNAGKTIRLFSLRGSYDEWRFYNDLFNDSRGISAKLIRSDRWEAEILVNIPSVDVGLSGSVLTVASYYIGRVWKSEPLIVKCCTLKKLSKPMTPLDPRAATSRECFSELAVNHEKGEMFQESSFLRKLDLTCDAQSQWIYPDNVTFIDKDNVFDFTENNKKLKAGQPVIFICKGNQSDAVSLTVGNKTTEDINGTAWANITLLPEHNDQEATCETSNMQHVKKLNVLFSPIVVDDLSFPRLLQKGSSGHVIINVQSNPPVTAGSSIIMLHGPKGNVLFNFYILHDEEEETTKSQVVVDFTEVKKIDFGRYSLSVGISSSQSKAIADFRVDEATALPSNQAPDGEIIAAIFLSILLAICLVALIALGIVYYKKQSSDSMPEPPLKTLEDNSRQMTRQNDEGLYCEADAYENVRNKATAPQQDETYENTVF